MSYNNAVAWIITKLVISPETNDCGKRRRPRLGKRNMARPVVVRRSPQEGWQRLDVVR